MVHYHMADNETLRSKIVFSANQFIEKLFLVKAQLKNFNVPKLSFLISIICIEMQITSFNFPCTEKFEPVYQ